jgi:hypothetical protein
MDDGTFFNSMFYVVSSTLDVKLNSLSWVSPQYWTGYICNIILFSCCPKIKVPLPQSFFALI